jgi:wyosine [tRNA(Phe)-imidazoG37] synthetase (radical SAM superfamily)
MAYRVAEMPARRNPKYITVAIARRPRYTAGVNILSAHREHPRHWEHFRFVYPVISRRSHGLSVGINVNPDKRCNFDCLYCQVDRTVPPTVTRFDLAEAERELRELLAMDLSRYPPFDAVPPEQLRLRDIALSGDAEPTTLPEFSRVIEMIARVKPPGCKIVLITDAGGLDRTEVKRGLALMDRNDGEVWGKLDAGTEEYFRRVNRTAIPFTRILNNLAATARARPIVIQSLFFKIHGVGPGAAEIGAYCQRLKEIGNIRLVQVYTLARRAMTVVDGVPAWKFCAALADDELDEIAARVRCETGLAAESFYGAP